MNTDEQKYCAACGHPLLPNETTHICQEVLERKLQEYRSVGSELSHEQIEAANHYLHLKYGTLPYRLTPAEMRELATHLQVEQDYNRLAAENERLVGYYSKTMHRLRLQIERLEKAHEKPEAAPPINAWQLAVAIAGNLAAMGFVAKTPWQAQNGSQGTQEG